VKRYRLVLALLLVLLLGALAAPALATPTADLAALAKYYGADAPLFATIRSDEAYVQSLDTLLEALKAKLPAESRPAQRLTDLLDVLAQQASAPDFQTGIRSWLGNSIAVGIPSLNVLKNTPAPNQPLFALAVRDREAAKTFWERFVNNNSGTSKFAFEDKDGYSLMLAEKDNPARGGLLISDDVLLLGATDLESVYQNTSANLATSAKFTDSLALLPEKDYDGLIYLDIGQILAFTSRGNSLGLTPQQIGGLVDTQVYGLTLQDNKTLIADVVTKAGDLTPVRQAEIPLPQLNPVDPSFAAYIPADASLVLHSTSLKGLYELLLAAGRMDNRAGFEKNLEQARLGIRGLLGLNLENDIVNWMTGDYAAFASFDSNTIIGKMRQTISDHTDPVFTQLPIEFGLVIKATDPAKAKAFASALHKFLPRQFAKQRDLKITQAKIGGVDASIITFQASMSPTNKVPVDVVVAANDKVFVVATRKSAEAILTGAPGLDTSPSFKAAGQYLLSNPTSIWYADTNAISTVLNLGVLSFAVVQPMSMPPVVAEANGTPQPTESAEALQQAQDARTAAELQQFDTVISVVSLFNSGSITTQSVDASGTSRVRLVITLNP
jgi:hypothetical protein